MATTGTLSVLSSLTSSLRLRICSLRPVIITVLAGMGNVSGIRDLAPAFERASGHKVVVRFVQTADLPGVLVQLRRVLKPDGLLLAAMLGGQTLVELRTALFEAQLVEEGGVSPLVSPVNYALSDVSCVSVAGFIYGKRDPPKVGSARPV